MPLADLLAEEMTRAPEYRATAELCNVAVQAERFLRSDTVEAATALEVAIALLRERVAGR